MIRDAAEGQPIGHPGQFRRQAAAADGEERGACKDAQLHLDQPTSEDRADDAQPAGAQRDADANLAHAPTNRMIQRGPLKTSSTR